MRRRKFEEFASSVDQRIEGVHAEVGHIREEVVRKLERLDAWLITRDPSTRAAAEAYDGLRKQVSAGAKARRMHLVDLAKLDLLVRTLETRVAEDPSTSAKDIMESLSAHTRQWAADAGLSVVESVSNQTIGHFEIVEQSGDKPANSAEVLKPAYLDESDGNTILIRRGTARIVHDPTLQPSAGDRDVAGSGQAESAADSQHVTGGLVREAGQADDRSDQQSTGSGEGSA